MVLKYVTKNGLRCQSLLTPRNRKPSSTGASAVGRFPTAP